MLFYFHQCYHFLEPKFGLDVSDLTGTISKSEDSFQYVLYKSSIILSYYNKQKTVVGKKHKTDGLTYEHPIRFFYVDRKKLRRIILLQMDPCPGHATLYHL